MCSTFLQILLIFSSPEGYRLQFPIPCAFFLYTVWHCTGQHCSLHVPIVCLLVCGASWWVLLKHSITLQRVFFIIECGMRAFSVLCVYPKFGHHPHPLGYLCAKFCFFCSLHCWANPWRKTAYSITQSPNLFDVPKTEACASENQNATKLDLKHLLCHPAEKRIGPILQLLETTRGIHILQTLVNKQ